MEDTRKIEISQCSRLQEPLKCKPRSFLQNTNAGSREVKQSSDTLLQSMPVWVAWVPPSEDYQKPRYCVWLSLDDGFEDAAVLTASVSVSSGTAPVSIVDPGPLAHGAFGWLVLLNCNCRIWDDGVY